MACYTKRDDRSWAALRYGNDRIRSTYRAQGVGDGVKALKPERVIILAQQAVIARHDPKALFLGAVEDLPHLGLGLEMVTAVALDRHAADQGPGLQLLEAGAHVRAGDLERVGDILGRQWLGCDVEQCVDLGDGAIDAPASRRW